MEGAEPAKARITVRQHEAKDWGEWLRLRVALWPNHSEEDHLSEMREYQSNEATLAVFVASRSNGRLAGFLEASIRPFADGCDTRPVGYIEGWYVDPDVRLQGVGRDLVREAERWAAAKGCQEMSSDCLIDNDSGHGAHLALGYEETERLIHFRKLLRLRPPS